MSDKALKAPSRLKGALLNWLGFRWTDYEQWRIFYNRESDSGERVSYETAIRLSAVYACTRLIAQRIATLPLNVYRVTDEGREADRRHPLSRLLRFRPNSKMTAPVFWEAVVSSILLQRGAYLEPVENPAGNQLAAINFIHPLLIALDKDRGEYKITEKDGSTRWVPEGRIVYIPAFSTDGETGVSVIEYGLQTIGNAIAADKVAGKTFRNGLQLTTYFKYPKVLRDTQREDAREMIKKVSGAAEAGNPVILEADMDAGTIGINPKDAQLLESRQASTEEICSLFGVPPTMIGRGDKASSWASSSEHLNLWFLNYTLMPWMRRIEVAMSDGFLRPHEQVDHYVEFNAEGMLRGDSAARREFYASAGQNGWMNRNEIRAKENLPPIPGGDVYTVQSNLVPLDRLGATDPQQNFRNALDAFLREVKQ